MRNHVAPQPEGHDQTAEITLENSFRGTGELSAFLSVALAMRTQDMDHEYESASLLRFVKQRDLSQGRHRLKSQQTGRHAG